jgi:hypothetical protein
MWKPQVASKASDVNVRAQSALSNRSKCNAKYCAKDNHLLKHGYELRCKDSISKRGTLLAVEHSIRQNELNVLFLMACACGISEEVNVWSPCRRCRRFVESPSVTAQEQLVGILVRVQVGGLRTI